MRESEKFQNLLESEGLHAWLSILESDPNVFNITLPLMIAFPTTWLVEAGFSAVCDILNKKGNRLDIENRGLLRLRLNQNLMVDIDYHVKSHHDHMS